MKSESKQKAIRLRKQGRTYSEILNEVPVTKSTLSLWLRKVGLSKTQNQKLTEKKKKAALRGSEARHSQRIASTEFIKTNAVNEISNISFDNEKLFLIGCMLYWAEGDKEKSYRSGVGIGFSNSDSDMVVLFLKWLKECLDMPKERVTFRIYLHRNNAFRAEEVKQYWATQTGFSLDKFDKITLKRHNPSSSRRNKGKDYYGTIRVKVTKSTDLNRKITGWIDGIKRQCLVV